MGTGKEEEREGRKVHSTLLQGWQKVVKREEARRASAKGCENQGTKCAKWGRVWGGVSAPQLTKRSVGVL